MDPYELARIEAVRDVDSELKMIAHESVDVVLKKAREFIDSHSWTHNFNCEDILKVIDEALGEGDGEEN
jgi:hypothetical protein